MDEFPRRQMCVAQDIVTKFIILQRSDNNLIEKSETLATGAATDE